MNDYFEVMEGPLGRVLRAVLNREGAEEEA